MPGSAWKGGGVSKHEMISSANDQILTTLKQEWDSIKFLNGWLKFLFGDVKLALMVTELPEVLRHNFKWKDCQSYSKTCGRGGGLVARDWEVLGSTPTISKLS